MSAEVLEGYVVDIACLRKWPQAELLSRATKHSKECVLMGHCLESGYGLVDAGGRSLLLDSEATRPVIEAVRLCPRERGIKLRVEREQRNHELVTRSVVVNDDDISL